MDESDTASTDSVSEAVPKRHCPSRSARQRKMQVDIPHFSSDSEPQEELPQGHNVDVSDSDDPEFAEPGPSRGIRKTQPRRARKTLPAKPKPVSGKNSRKQRRRKAEPKNQPAAAAVVRPELVHRTGDWRLESEEDSESDNDHPFLR